MVLVGGARCFGQAEKSEGDQSAKALRAPPPTATGEEIGNWAATPPTTRPSTQPATRPSRIQEPVGFSADKSESIQTSDDTVALVMSGNVKLFQRRGQSEYLEMQAD